MLLVVMLMGVAGEVFRIWEQENNYQENPENGSVAEEK
jgi:hypothetical protein